MAKPASHRISQLLLPLQAKPINQKMLVDESKYAPDDIEV